MIDDNKKKSIKGGNIMLTLGKTLMILKARQRKHYLNIQHVRINRFLKALMTDRENYHQEERFPYLIKGQKEVRYFRTSNINVKLIERKSKFQIYKKKQSFKEQEYLGETKVNIISSEHLLKFKAIVEKT